MIYAQKRKDKLLIFMVLIVWVLSGLISMPPILGWGRASQTLKEKGICLVSQEFGYQIYATVFAFYIPLSIMIFLYMKIFKTVKEIKEKEIKSCGRIMSSKTDESIGMITKSPLFLGNKNHEENGKHLNASKLSLGRRLTYFFTEFKPHTSTTNENQKAIHTLGIIMGIKTSLYPKFFN